MFAKTKNDPSTTLLLMKARRKSRRRTTLTTFVVTSVAYWLAAEIMERTGDLKIKTKSYETPERD